MFAISGGSWISHRGHQRQRGHGNLLFSLIFLNTSWKWRKLGREEGRASKMCLCRSATGNRYSKWICNINLCILDDKKVCVIKSIKIYMLQLPRVRSHWANSERDIALFELSFVQCKWTLNITKAHKFKSICSVFM